MIPASKFYTTEDPQYFKLERQVVIGRPGFSSMFPEVSSLDVMAFDRGRELPVRYWSLGYDQMRVTIDGNCEVITFRVPSNQDGKLQLCFDAMENVYAGLPEPQEKDINVRRS
jgi:hypothetical protein